MRTVVRSRRVYRLPKAFVRQHNDSAAGRISTVVAAALFSCILIGTAIEGLNPSLQVFESFGVAKRVGLPVIYLLALIALIIPFRHQVRRLSRPLWWSSLYGMLVLSILLALLVNRQEIDLNPFAQSFALVAGLLLFAFLGLHAAVWTAREERLLVTVLAAGALIVEFGQMSPGPFGSLVIPAAAGLIYRGLRISEHRGLQIILGVALAVSVAITIVSNPNESIAFLFQAGICGALLLVAILPRAIRPVAAVIGTVGAAVAVSASGLWSLMLADPTATTDVTLTHRAYEAGQVYLHLQDNLLTAVFGLGPSATVDLSQSPDANTLVNSGRDLSAVDDVHFLTSWLMLKFGALGLIWALIFLVAVAREAKHLLSAKVPDPFGCFLLFFVIAGLANSLSAATNFYSNVLPALFLGVLYARRSVRRRAPSDTPVAGH